MLKTYWKRFLAESGKDENSAYAWSICFGMNREEADRAAERVRSGEKRAMIYPADGYRANMNRPVKPGDFIIVCDWQENPRAVVEVQRVQNLALCDITEEQIKLEAEARNPEHWQEVRLPAIKTEVEEVCGEFSEDAELIFVEFRMVYSA